MSSLVLKPLIKKIERERVTIQSALKVKNEMMLLSCIRNIDVSEFNIGNQSLPSIINRLIQILRPGMSKEAWYDVDIYGRQILAILDLILREYKQS